MVKKILLFWKKFLQVNNDIICSEFLLEYENFNKTFELVLLNSRQENIDEEKEENQIFKYVSRKNTKKIELGDVFPN